MNKQLTDQIVKHIFNNLGITLNLKNSIRNNNYLLNVKLETSEEPFFLPIWGAEVLIEKSKFQLLFTDLSVKPNEDEWLYDYILLVKYENSPLFGLNLIFNTDEIESSLISVSFNEDVWLNTNISVQANFLSGMENLKEVTSIWNKSSEDLVKHLKPFIEHCNFISE